jgi:hypothetical protein
MKGFPVALLGVVLITGGFTSRSEGQDQPPSHSKVGPRMPPRLPSRGQDPLDINNTPAIEMPNDRAQEIAKLHAEERHKKLAEDTERLVGLARDLSSQMRQSDAGTLSADQIKKLDAIERLAHGVKERMKS